MFCFSGKQTYLFHNVARSTEIHAEEACISWQSCTFLFIAVFKKQLKSLLNQNLCQKKIFPLISRWNTNTGTSFAPCYGKIWSSAWIKSLHLYLKFLFLSEWCPLTLQDCLKAHAPSINYFKSSLFYISPILYHLMLWPSVPHIFFNEAFPLVGLSLVLPRNPEASSQLYNAYWLWCKLSNLSFLPPQLLAYTFPPGEQNKQSSTETCYFQSPKESINNSKEIFALMMNIGKEGRRA